ncbi:TraR/DksA C4-type zinc finger protein [Sandaracinobacter sp. RS1-74]|uniref:TraR/DksA C4-type zinc finger protein n=1 Tax=Sandaracinobacteroides sayramensis TaxID=2913411 RepID=UPI001EDA79F3|nr:TraR/DksA C4-type zinc finger protein [Sandaracinobacteroides sayramensis]MCG2839676.1 TraR/DksA C4-type zinc finger protein [Sandaracinobacteroides sayramensis]
MPFCCPRCGHAGAPGSPVPAGRRLRCSVCDWRGLPGEAASMPAPKAAPLPTEEPALFQAPSHEEPEGSPIPCGRCGEDISEGRLKAMPATRLCTPCAAMAPVGQRARRAEEWGSREDYRRDRASWKRGGSG